tara:strand:- start:88 stop:285 length:198 start_codon:yes stop_codon:yes gene_type:complete
MGDTHSKCELCSVDDHLIRVPQIPSIKEIAAPNNTIGNVTKDYIKQNQELLKQMKKEARSQTYED